VLFYIPNQRICKYWLYQINIKGIVALPVSKQEAPMWQKGCFLYFCMWKVYCSSVFDDVFLEFLLKIYKLKYMAFYVTITDFDIQVIGAKKGEISKCELFNLRIWRITLFLYLYQIYIIQLWTAKWSCVWNVIQTIEPHYVSTQVGRKKIACFLI
jgi:hypothetical protein